YFNAVWVKNEWSRFLKLMVKDKSKHLIPCFKGIDAYDMPKEFARLQAQDLGKVGATQDLLRGIGKILPKEQKNTVVIQEKVVVGGSGGNKIASLLDRGNMALEDGDWAKADSFFEDVLNNDSKNAQAYLGKTLALERCRTIDALVRKRKDATQRVQGERLHLEPNRAHVEEMVAQCSIPGYIEAREIRKLYEFDLSYRSDVAERRQQYWNEESWWANHKQLSRAEKFAAGEMAEHLQREKKALLAALSDRVKQAETAEAAAKKKVQERYAQHITHADAEAEKLYNDGLNRREVEYQELIQTAKTSSDVAELTETAKKFDALGNYQDSKNLAEHCRKCAAEEQAKLDAERTRAEENARKKRNQKKIAIVSGVIGLLILITVSVFFGISSTRKSNEERILAALAGYRDSASELCYNWDTFSVSGQNYTPYYFNADICFSEDASYVTVSYKMKMTVNGDYGEVTAEETSSYRFEYDDEFDTEPFIVLDNGLRLSIWYKTGGKSVLGKDEYSTDIPAGELTIDHFMWR
ncbi:MAG: hypothetical protein IKC09_08420, partial [Oscillospiraceae bacterium]|nr:hypothetical protein [Oscillospiraceae bacterium]